MFGRVQTSPVLLRGYRLGPPSSKSKISSARLLSVTSTRSLRPTPSSLGPCQKSRNIWGWSTGATSSPVQAVATPPPPEIPAQQPAVATATSEELIGTTVSSDLPSDPIINIPVPTDVSVPLEIPPLNYGDLAALGFAHWTPAGICQWAMELIQVSTGIPWFWTIVTATVVTRLIVLPLNISSLRLTARLAPYQPRLTELRAQLSATSITRDPIAVQRLSLQQKKVYEQANVSLIQPMLVPFVQLPLSLGMFIGVKKLCDFPLEQLHNSGVSFLPDLTVADPTYILPLAMAALINVQLSIGAKDMTVDATQTLHIFNLFKAVSLISIPFMANLPAGVMVYLITGVVSMTTQSLILRRPIVRKALKIPIISPTMRVKAPTFLESVRFSLDWLQGRSAQAQAQAQSRKKK